MKKIFLLFSALTILSLACDPDEPEAPATFDPTPFLLDAGSFPPPPIPADNQLTMAGVELGRMLFYEKMLSKDGTQSCADCHLQKDGFSDVRRFSLGVEGLPGKRQACALLVANERTRAALPCKGKRVIEMVENGVDFELWHDRERPARPRGDATRFVFLGRLVDWKAVDLLLAAFADAAARAPMSLTILGDGPERGKLEAIAQAHDMLSDTLETGKVWFAGWRPQVECATLLAQHDALGLPSLYECGGAVVLEAMAMRLPVIATKGGGPADYLDPTCGILVEPNTRETFVAGLTEGLVRLALSPELRTAMGRAGQDRVKEHFDWRIKIERMIKIYRDIVAQGVRP